MNLLTALPLIVDFETTGTEPETARAVEVAAVVIEGPLCHRYSALLNPGIPIPPEASAIHHLIDSDVADALTWAEAKVNILTQPFDLLVAHYAAFDMQFFAQDGGLPEGKPVLCTWRMAKKLLPDLPNYSNMALHYRLGLPGRPTESHRAMADATVTANLYQYLLGIVKNTAKDPEYVDADRFVAYVNAPMMEKKIRFGKYYDQLWADVAKTDRSYLKWVLEKSDIAANNEDIRFTIETLLKGA